MFDFESLIGLEKEEALKILEAGGYKNVDVVINSKSNDLCDTYLVCKAENQNGRVVLICGEFYLKIKG